MDYQVKYDRPLTKDSVRFYDKPATRLDAVPPAVFYSIDNRTGRHREPEPIPLPKWDAALENRKKKLGHGIKKR